VLALVAVLVGGGSTLIADQVWLRAWADSGQRFAVDQWHTIELPEGRTLVYYESPSGSVPSMNVDFNIRDPDDKYVFLHHHAEDDSFVLPFDGPAGRAMWEVELPEPTRFSFEAKNHNPLETGESREGDRVVFGKDPPTLEQAQQMQKTIRITGGTVTLVLALMFYALHWFTLREMK
jgi:hypothetical protein